MTKLDAILAENPGKSLDELLASRKINADQKAQASKKPSLQSQLAQLEEQIAQYKKVDADYQSRMSAQHTQLSSTHKSEIEKIKASLKEQHDAELKSSLRQNLLIFSQFLRAAAAKRVVEEEADTEESKAFEGALLLVYGGDEKAVDAALNLIEGSDEQVTSVDGEPLSVKCKKKSWLFARETRR
jgi:translation elongation factor P/translation initiation factor 5A